MKEWLKYNWDTLLGTIVVIMIFVTPIVLCVRDVIKENRKFEEQKIIQRNFFDGSHELRCLGNKSSVSGKLEAGGSFLGWSAKGNISGGESIKFIWINEDNGELIPTVLPVNKVRIMELSPNDSRKPFVIFSWWYTRNYYTFDNEWPSLICTAYLYIKSDQVDDKIYFKFDTNN